MKRKRLLFLLILLALFASPQINHAEEIGATETGIGFKRSGAEQPPKETPVDHVLIQTTNQSLSITQSQTSQIKKFPQTGDQPFLGLRLLGFLCLTGFFWLFLYNQLAEEEKKVE